MKKSLKVKITGVLIIFSIFFGNCKKPEDLAVLMTPITYAIAKNALAQNKEKGEYIIKLTFNTLKREKGDWPSGEVNYEIETPDYPDKIVKIQYILNGSHQATSIIDIPKQDKKQFQINLVENAIVFGQARTTETYISDLAQKVSPNIDKKLKIAVFDFEGVLGEDTIFGKRIAESLISHLVQNQLQVVERKLLASLLKELSFQKSGLTDTNSAEIRNKIGKFLGAEAILMGTIKNEKEEILINARIVEIEKGIILSTGQVIIPKYLVPQKDLDMGSPKNPRK